MIRCDKNSIVLLRSAPFRKIKNISRLVVELFHFGWVTGQPVINYLPMSDEESSAVKTKHRKECLLEKKL